MQEVDLLKYILLNNEQLNIFNFVSKPSIDTDRVDIYTRLEQKYALKDTDLFQKEEILRTHKSYTKLNNDRGNNINRRLIQLADLEIDYLAQEEEEL